jgi:hypothetical protein
MTDYAETVEKVVLGNQNYHSKTQDIPKSEFIKLQMNLEYLKLVGPSVGIADVELLKVEQTKENTYEIHLYQYPDTENSTGHAMVKRYLNVEKFRYEVFQTLNLDDFIFTFKIVPPVKYYQ